MKTKFNSEESQAVFERLKARFVIYAPVVQAGAGAFSDTDLATYARVNSFEEIDFFRRTEFSAKSVLSPIRETLFISKDKNTRAGRSLAPAEETPESRETLVFLRACDIHAIERTDLHFLKEGGFEDCYYKHRRDKLKIFLIECVESFPGCFCVSMGTNRTDDYSVFIRKKDSGFEVSVKAEEFKQYFPGSEEEIAEPNFAKRNELSVRPPENITPALFEDEIWKEYSGRCIACGRCTVSCPSCTCFTLRDITSEDKSSLERKRIWSSCLVKDFAMLAGKHDFRKEKGDRLRYRILHKIYDFRKRNKVDLCVGCGRCEEVCPEYISTAGCIEKINRISERAK